jgi:hypothetical protein
MHARLIGNYVAISGGLRFYRAPCWKHEGVVQVFLCNDCVCTRDQTRKPDRVLPASRCDSNGAHTRVRESFDVPQREETRMKMRVRRDVVWRFLGVAQVASPAASVVSNRLDARRASQHTLAIRWHPRLLLGGGGVHVFPRHLRRDETPASAEFPQREGSRRHARALTDPSEWASASAGSHAVTAQPGELTATSTINGRAGHWPVELRRCLPRSARRFRELAAEWARGLADTETGAYTLEAGTPCPDTNGSDALIRKRAAPPPFLPSDDRVVQGGLLLSAARTYYDYPARTNTQVVLRRPSPGANQAKLQQRGR